MRKVNFNDYESYTFKDAGFSFTSHNLKEVVNLFNERKSGVIYGNKKGGGMTILDGIIK